MLVSSILKLFYWLGSRFDTPLLLQAILMCIVQVILLHVALANRTSVLPTLPSSSLRPRTSSRPYSFWRWTAQRPYWNFLGSYTAALAVLQFLMGNHSTAYTSLQGLVALGIEAILPVPQILQNRRLRSCKGFRFSVLANWVVGDAFKLSYLFIKPVPWVFRFCAIFQAVCDALLGLQFAMYGDTPTITLEDGKA
ncbi:hypothetical protein K470DRAFT_255219 [Piedraia hortae CBS 480.64]|uniref:PQ loop repeat protein n=1 Tax=Piedraia hortae CBS 480.64 TaxID=1314780 RepID=A0A6A7C6G3_9PEZI|nr:hypothetical protein K470DRAFT_255219 [Piedraia hortae CBS 480.64]